MKYDDASWHYGGDFPSGLPESAGATHMGMFIVWLFLAGLSNKEDPIDLDSLISRKQTPGEFVMSELDEKFVDLFLSEEGNAFAQVYYASDRAKYIFDYEMTIAKNLPTVYHVKDTWQNYDLLKPVIDKRYEDWRNKNSKSNRSDSGENLIQRILSRFSKKG